MKASSSQGKTISKKRAPKKFRMEVRWDDSLPDWPSRLLTYAVILGIINPILYFAFDFRAERPFFIASFQLLVFIVIIDVLNYIWYRIKHWKNKR